jgi:hypothetical protein
VKGGMRVHYRAADSPGQVVELENFPFSWETFAILQRMQRLCHNLRMEGVSEDGWKMMVYVDSLILEYGDVMRLNMLVP